MSRRASATRETGECRARPVRSAARSRRARSARTPPARPEPDARADRDVCVARESQREFEGPELRVRVGQRRPEEHRRGGQGRVPADPFEAVVQRVAPRAVDLAHLVGMVRRLGQRDHRRDLDRRERPVVEPRLQPRERTDDLRVPDEEADAPAGHREALRERVQLDGDVVGAVRLEDRRRLLAETELCVREVVHDDELALAGEVDDALHEREIDRRGRRVVREREQHDARARTRALVRLDEVAEEILARTHGHARHRRARQDRRVDVDRIARAGHERRVARLDERPEQVREAFLRPDRRDGLRLGVESDAPEPLVPLADREPQSRDPAARGVSVVARDVRGLGELVDDDRR